jgi:hypothetical protein
MQKKSVKKSAIFKHKNIVYIISIFIVFLLVVPVYIPVADAYFNNQKSKINNRIYDFLLRLVDRFPNIVNISFFNRLLEKFSLSEADDYNGVEDSNSDNTEIEDSNSDNAEIEDSNSDTRGHYETIGNVLNNTYQIFSNLSYEDKDMQDLSIMQKQEVINASENVTIFPSSGKFIFIGYGTLDVDLAFDFNGTIVTLTGSLFMGPEPTMLSFAWNVSQGYLEISNDGYIEFSNLLFSADDQINQIIFSVDLINIIGSSYLLLEQHASSGSLICDGILVLEGLSFDINLDNMMGLTVSFGASFNFSSSVSEAQNLNISWGEDGFSANGSFSINSYLEINDFFLSINNINISSNQIDILVAVESIILDSSSVSFDFQETEDDIVICRIVGRSIEINSLSIIFGVDKDEYYSIFVESIQINRMLNLTLTISSDSYVSVEEGRISISGNIVISLNRVFDIDGTIIEIQGIFVMESFDDGLNIWWNKTTGFLCINSTSRVSMMNFNIRIDDSWVDISWNKLVLNPGASIIISKLENTNKTRIVFQGGIAQILNMQISAQIADFSLSIGLIQLMHFEQNNNCYFDVIFGDNSTQVSANMALGHSLTVKDLTFSYPGGSVALDGLTIFGYWQLYSDIDTLSLNVVGAIQIVGLSIPGQVSIPYFRMTGSSYMIMSRGVIRFWVSVSGELAIGISGLGSFNIRIFGFANIIWNLETGEIYGEFSYVGGVSGTIPGFNIGGIIFISSISVNLNFAGDGTFTIKDGELYMQTSGEFAGIVGLGVSVHIDNLVFGCSVRVDFYGTYNAYVSYNFRTGAFNAAFSASGVAIIEISRLYLYGDDIHIDQDTWAKLAKLVGPLPPQLYYISCYIESIDSDFEGKFVAVVFFFIGISAWSDETSSGFGLGFGFMFWSLHGELDFEININNIEVKTIEPILINETTGEYIDFLFTIESILIDGDFAVEAIFSNTRIRLNGSAEINNINFLINQINGDGFLNFSLGCIKLTGTVFIQMPNILPGGTFYIAEGSSILTITAPNAELVIEDLSIEGFATDFLGGVLTLNFSFDSVTLSSGGLRITFIADKDYMASLYQEIIWAMENDDPIYTSLLRDILKNATILIEGDGSLSIQGLNFNGSINNVVFENGVNFSTNFNFSADEITFSMQGYIRINANGTMQANALLGLYLENVSFSLKDTIIRNIFENLDLEIDDFTFNITKGRIFGHFQAYIGENGSTVYDFQGFMYVSGLEWSISGKNIYGGGNFSGSGKVRIMFRNNSDGNVDLIHVSFIGEVHTNVTIYGNIPGMPGIAGLFSGNWSFNLVNFSGGDFGTIMFEWDMAKKELYLANTHRNATWDAFNFSIGDGLITAEIDTFLGDLKLFDWKLPLFGTEAEDLFSVLNGIMAMWQQFLEQFNNGTKIGDYNFTGIADPDNWNLSSDGGYETIFGFSFSSNMGALLSGELAEHYFDLFSVKHFYCSPGTYGFVDVGVNENGDFLFQLNVTQGYAEIVFGVNIPGAGQLLFALNPDSASLGVPVGSLAGFFSNLLQGNFGGVLGWLNNEDFWSSLYYLSENTYIQLSSGNIIPFQAFLLLQLQQFLQNHGLDLPEALRKKLLELINQTQNITVCFLVGTQIRMADGSLKNIENIEVGDKVRSYDKESGEWKTGTVSNVFHHSPSEMTDYYLLLNDDLGVTPNHPIMVNGVWITAGQLNIGDVYGGNIITSIERIYERVSTFNFEVVPYHTYSVVWGESRISSIAHNSGRHNVSGVGWGEVNGNESDGDSTTGDKLNLSDICFLAGTLIAMANGEIRPIESINPGDEVIAYFPGGLFGGGGIFNSKVEQVITHQPYEMIQGYVEITVESTESNYYQTGPHLVPYLVNSSSAETFKINVTPNHPLIITYTDPFEPQITPIGLPPTPIEMFIVDAGEIEPGMYIFGGMVVSVEYHPNARKHSYHLLTDNPYPYLIVSEEQQAMVTYLSKLLMKKDDDSSMLRIPRPQFMFWGALDKNNSNNTSSNNTNNNTTCFIKGTQIGMYNGTTKNIEEINIGDEVLSYDKKSGEWKNGTVSNVFHHSPSEMTDYYLVLNNELSVTPNHPFYVDGVWVDAGDLKIGDNIGGNIINSIEKVYTRVPTYNFEVKLYHTYTVLWGDCEVFSIVHNANLQYFITGDKNDSGGNESNGTSYNNIYSMNFIPVNANIVYFYIDTTLDSRYIYCYTKSQTHENQYKLYEYFDLEEQVIYAYEDVGVGMIEGSVPRYENSNDIEYHDSFYPVFSMEL